MAHVVAEPCIGVKDHACVNECPVDCFYEGGDQLFIHSMDCIDCGLCVEVCPVSAIFKDEDLPEKWKDFAKKNDDATKDYALPKAVTKQVWDQSKS